MLACELENEPGIYRPKQDFATFGACAQAGDLVKKPHQFGTREVGVEDKASLFANHIG